MNDTNRPAAGPPAAGGPTAEVAHPGATAAALPSCANCRAPVSGPFCAQCGQRVEPRIHSLPRFAHEAFETVTHADSRLWQTLVPLLVRPGHLTREFLRGRRARYLPPFRLYLVVSLSFFLLIAALSGNDGGLVRTGELGAGAAAPATIVIEAPGAPNDAQAQQLDARQARLDEQIAELDARIRAARSPEERAMLERSRQVLAAGRSGLEAIATRPDAPPRAQAPDRSGETAAERTERVCSLVYSGPWKSHIEPRLKAGCRKIVADQGRDLGQKFLQNVPRAMFFFLPFLALVMKLMYRRPRRYYVEHLLFFIHNHAFAFLFLGLYLLVSLVVPQGAVAETLGLAVFAYVLWYFYRSMRRVYEESARRTLAKFTLLACTYLASGGVMLLLTALVSVVML